MAMLADYDNVVAERDQLRAENERLQSAMKVIYTWANMDTKQEHYDRPRDLVAEDVKQLCQRAMNSSTETEHD